ncbi:hypothetical protein H0O00_00920 [Candidatus Micrarchaeota archaeon]|nr:hypothetical protein [Candidatus Micrarchaeota archaeon]
MAEKPRFSIPSGKGAADSQNGHSGQEPSPLMKSALERSKHRICDSAQSSHFPAGPSSTSSRNAARARAVAASWGAFLPLPEASAAKKEEPGQLPETVPSPFCLEAAKSSDPAKVQPTLDLFALPAVPQAPKGIELPAHVPHMPVYLSPPSKQVERLGRQLRDKFGYDGSTTGPAGDKFSFEQALPGLTKEAENKSAFWLRFSSIHFVTERYISGSGSRPYKKKACAPHIPSGRGDPTGYHTTIVTETEPCATYSDRSAIKLKLWLPIRMAKAAVYATLAGAVIWIGASFIDFPPPQRFLSSQYTEFGKFLTSCENRDIAAAASEGKYRSDGLTGRLLCAEELYTSFDGKWKPLGVITEKIYGEEYGSVGRDGKIELERSFVERKSIVIDESEKSK